MSQIDNLQREFDTLTAGITQTLERAADEGRDLTDDENGAIERDDKRRDFIEKELTRLNGLLERDQRVAKLRASVASGPQIVRNAEGARDPQAELLRMFPTTGDYAATLHRATAKRDRDAGAKIERAMELLGEINRATAHQTTTDNPGLIPEPIVGPLVDRLMQRRPFLSSITVRPAPAPKFDRPRVVQQVAVGKQAAEKAATESQKLVTEPVPVALETFAGHLNISLQDIRWSQPSVLSLIYGSFEKIYARVTDKAAGADFAAGVTQTGSIGALDIDGITDALGDAGVTIGGTDDDEGSPDTVWMSRDVAVKIAQVRDANDQKAYNVPLIGGTGGDMEGLRVVVDGRFAAGTMIVGDSDLVEYWEALEGFLTVQEPDVLGQMVGYAGYGGLAVVEPAAFVKLTLPA